MSHCREILLGLYNVEYDLLPVYCDMMYVVVNVRISGGEKDYKELMNKFEFVSNAFLNLDEGYLCLPSFSSHIEN